MSHSLRRCGTAPPLAAALLVVVLVAWFVTTDVIAPPWAESTPSQPRTASATMTTERARPADAFVDSVGVTTHLHYDDTVYNQFASIIKPRLLELGVRHITDGAYTYPAAGPNSFYYERLRELAREGIRFNLGLAIDTPYSERTDIDKLDDVQRWTGGAVEAFGGANEPDISGAADWVTQTRDLQRDLWNKVAQDPELQGVDVVAPSPVWRPGDLGDISQWVDYGNWHPYPGGNCPTCSDVYGSSFDTRVDAYRAPTGDKPLMLTETGYHNAVDTTDDHRPASERAAGKYVPRLLFEHFNRGVRRSYLYELINVRASDKPDENFGLLRNDGSRKPAFIALRNLLDLLSDDGPAFHPGSLAYRLTGATDRVHSTLLQKRDGTFYLTLWQERSSYDTGLRPNKPDNLSERGDVSVLDQSVTIVLDEPAEGINLYRPAADVSAQRTWRGTSSVTIAVPDEVVVVEISPTREPELGQVPPDKDPVVPVTEPGTACRGLTARFDDVPEDHTFAAEISCLRGWDITRGVGDGTRFQPDRALPRWQMAVFIDRLVRLEGDDPATPPTARFNDIATLSSETRDAIARMEQLGVIKGTSRRIFSPHNRVTRGQIAAFLSRLDTVDGSAHSGIDYFDDDDSSVHEAAINVMAAEGLMQGSGGGRFRPNAPLSRGQMAAVLTRYIQMRIDDGSAVTMP